MDRVEKKNTLTASHMSPGHYSVSHHHQQHDLGHKIIAKTPHHTPPNVHLVPHGTYVG